MFVIMAVATDVRTMRGAGACQRTSCMPMLQSAESGTCGLTTSRPSPPCQVHCPTDSAEYCVRVLLCAIGGALRRQLVRWRMVLRRFISRGADSNTRGAEGHATRDRRRSNAKPRKGLAATGKYEHDGPVASSVFSGAIPAASERSHEWDSACLQPLTLSNVPNGMRVASNVIWIWIDGGFRNFP